MEYALFFYLADITHRLTPLFAVAGVLIGCFGFFAGAAYERVSISIFSCIIGLFFLIAAILIPSKNTIYVFMGLKAGHEILQNDKANNILDKTYKVIDKKLDEYLKSKD